MAERAPKLRWEECGGSDDQPRWCAECGPCILEVEARVASFYWHMSTYPADQSGEADSLLAAQLAAEDAALTWLREGVEALGGRVLDARTLKRVIAALNLVALDDVRLDETREAARKLARELGGGT